MNRAVTHGLAAVASTALTIGGFALSSRSTSTTDLGGGSADIVKCTSGGGLSFSPVDPNTGVNFCATTTTTTSTTSTTIAPTTTTVAPTTTTIPVAQVRIEFAAVDQLGRPVPPANLTAALAEARTHNLISASVKQLMQFQPYMAQMRTTNPALKFIVYVDGSHTSDSTLPESYYAHSSLNANPRTRIFNPAYPQNAEMDMTVGSGWEKYYDTEVIAAIKATGADGTFDDSEGSGACALSPVHPAGTENAGKVWTLTECLTATHQDALNAQTASGGILLANGLASGSAFVNAQSSLLLPGIYGGDAEEFPSVGSLTGWLNNLQMLATPGSVIMTNTKFVDSDQWHRFTEATFDLGTNGIDVYYFEGKNTNLDSNAADTYAAQAQALGSAIGPYGAVGNGYARQFQNGLVIVNPTNAPVSFAFPSSTNLNGQVVTSETLAPQSGDILLTH